jgi:hypothetical protein
MDESYWHNPGTQLLKGISVENVGAGPEIGDSDDGIPTLPTSNNPSQATASWIKVTCRRKQHKPHSKAVREEQSKRKAHSVYLT